MPLSIDVLTLAPVPLITAFVSAVGLAVPALPRRCYPLVAIAAGIAWCTIVAAVAGTSPAEAALHGVVAGLAASGLYSAAVKPVQSRIAL
jgi:hypothetical protein